MLAIAVRAAALLAVAALLGACTTSRPPQQVGSDRPVWEQQGFQSGQGTVIRVQPGDTLFRLAERHGSTVDGAIAANRISDPRRLTVGQALFLPRAGTRPQRPRDPGGRDYAQAPGSRPPVALPRPKPSVSPAPRPRPILADAPAPRPASFAWPLRGRILVGFGTRANGERNDGINIAAEAGAPVRAAADGVVTYAGNELRGYGNLVLIRHDNGYVTAYAHASRLKVERGQTVRRGEVIALAGQTGVVDRPQLHFEIRRGVTPVDPRPYLGMDMASY